MCAKEFREELGGGRQVNAARKVAEKACGVSIGEGNSGEDGVPMSGWGMNPGQVAKRLETHGGFWTG